MNSLKTIFVSCLLLVSTVALCQFEQGFAEHKDGTRIHYKSFGEGKPLLVINGGPGFPSTQFQDLARGLAKDRRVIIFDQRGTGLSEVKYMNRSTISMAKMVEDIEVLREHLNINKWNILGHSFGGVLSMYYADKHEKRVNKLILSASGGMDLEFTVHMPANIQSRLGAGRVEKIAEINERYKLDRSNAQIHNERFGQVAWAYVYDKTQVDAVVKKWTEGDPFVFRVNDLIWQDLRKGPYNKKSEMAEFKRPVLILHGRQDIIGESVAMDSHMVFPNSRLEFINEASHYLWLDRPDEYFRLIDEFLK